MTDEQKPAEPQTTVTPPAQQTGDETRFTQADVDKIVGERARRAAEAAVAKLVTDMGYDSVDTLKKDSVEARKRRESEMSEVEKAQQEAEAARKERDALKLQVEQERQQRRIDRRDNAIEAAAQRARADAPRDVLLWAKEYARDLLDGMVADDGSVDEKAVEKIIAQCREARKGWFTGQAPGSPSNADGRVPQPDVNKMLDGVKRPRL